MMEASGKKISDFIYCGFHAIVFELRQLSLQSSVPADAQDTWWCCRMFHEVEMINAQTVICVLAMHALRKDKCPMTWNSLQLSCVYLKSLLQSIPPSCEIIDQCTMAISNAQQ